ncbi:MAG: methionine--tRNA ligase [Christensenellales bacterium]|jgi:methionyl-tRNA synthetase
MNNVNNSNGKSVKKVLIAGAWPYANGSLHIGHIAALLPGDVIARYHRAAGNEVYYVSGSDCHGTPVAIRAKQEGKSPQEISDFYHNEFSDTFEKLGFSYDQYGKTSSREHIDYVRSFHEKLYENDRFVYEKTTPQAHCLSCDEPLADRMVIGRCPHCGESARGDQCDACEAVLEPEDLLFPHCASCGERPEFRREKHLYIAISKLERELQEFLSAHENWRKNAIAFTKRYIDEGLRDRALTRALSWGIDVPKDGYEDKKIYIWAENVLGYLSMSKAVAERENRDFGALWKGENALHYYVHGKDNIPFHSIILPSLLIAHGDGWRLPDVFVSSEYMTLEGRRISTSQNWAIWAKDIASAQDPDSIRYYFIINGPEKRDGDFSWREYVNSHNGELLGAYGNFVNRSLVFVHKYLGGRVPEGKLDERMERKISVAFCRAGKSLEAGACKDALEEIFALVRAGNKYFDDAAPWRTRESDIADCKNAIFNCVQIIAALALLLEPFLPFSSRKIKFWLKLEGGWKAPHVECGRAIEPVEVLFKRLDRTSNDDVNPGRPWENKNE